MSPHERVEQIFASMVFNYSFEEMERLYAYLGAHLNVISKQDGSSEE